jgi:ATP-dependent HslUV protease ATP-binding subunit HslU
VEELTPRQIVAELDRYIIGQQEAKKAVAVALRNRYRRHRLPPELQDEIIPKNIIMIGPTGVGKTEIARRLAKLVKAPFVKVEATKFTEVGYVGKDVESMVRDLVEVAIRMVKQEKMAEVGEKANKLAEERILEILVPSPKRRKPIKNPMELLFGEMSEEDREEERAEDLQNNRMLRDRVAVELQSGALEDRQIEIEVRTSQWDMLFNLDRSAPKQRFISCTVFFVQTAHLKYGSQRPEVGSLRNTDIAADRRTVLSSSLFRQEVGTVPGSFAALFQRTSSG